MASAVGCWTLKTTLQSFALSGALVCALVIALLNPITPASVGLGRLAGLRKRSGVLRQRGGR